MTLNLTSAHSSLYC